jgi:hypothetical protein
VRATLLLCSRCNSQTSVTAGTVFQDKRKPLATWVAESDVSPAGPPLLQRL